MLPFTTYTFPEPLQSKTQDLANWLCLVVPPSLSDENMDLIQKISGALKADFTKDVFCFQETSAESVSISDVLPTTTKLIISFGVAPAMLGLWIDLPTTGMRKLESFSFILTLGLDALTKNANAKKELWKSMQLFLEPM